MRYDPHNYLEGRWKLKKFTSGELEVMQVLWEHGSLKPAAIQERFPRTIRNGALRSVLLVLLEKGHVTRKKDGIAFYYKAKTPQQRTFKHLVRNLRDVFCDGSSAALIAQLIQTEKLSQDDIEALQRITAEKAGDVKGDET